MAKKYRETGVIIRQEEIASGVFSMWIKTDKIAKNSAPGQFIAVYCSDGSRLLPRPISIAEIDREDDSIRIVYRVVGKGTHEFSFLRTSMQLDIMGPLGNGFPLKEKKALLVGGGIGIPPLLQLAKELTCEKQIVAGYKDQLFLDDEFESVGEFFTASETGEFGTKGTVMDAIRENQLKPDIIYACGPTPMLKAVKEYAEENKIEAWLSLEEKMACGIGACLSCVCKTKHKDSHTNVNNKRICKEGPVFRAEEVVL